MDDWWLNSQISVFGIDGETGDAYMLGVQICVDSIHWDMERVRKCPYCKHLVPDGSVSCPGCGSRLADALHYMGRATVTLYGPMPAATCLFDIPDGAVFEVLHKCRGDRRKYEPSEVILRFVGCKQVAKWIPNVSAWSPDSVERIMLYTDIECDVEIYPEGLEG